MGHNGLVAPVAAVEFAEEPLDRHVVHCVRDEVEFVVRRDVEVGGGIGCRALHEVHHVVNHKRGRCPARPARVGGPLGPDIRGRVVGPKFSFLHRAVVLAIATQGKAESVVGKLRAGHAPLGGKLRQFRPRLGAGVVGVPRVEDVLATVPKSRVNDAVDAKLVGVVTGRGGEARLLAPRVGGHVVIPPIAEVAKITRSEAHVDVPIHGHKGGVVARLARTGCHFRPRLGHGVKLPQVVERAIVAEPKAHPRFAVPGVANGISARYAGEVRERGPRVDVGVVLVDVVAVPVWGLACHEVARSFEGKTQAVVTHKSVGHGGEGSPGLGVGGGEGKHGNEEEEGANHGAKVGG